MKILITGGSGTIGRAFIKEYPEHTYFNVSRNEKFITDLSREYPGTRTYIGNIEDEGFLMRIFNHAKPDIVIHAAAMKHINIAEENPIQTCQSNVIGSINVINASIMNDVPITIGISTDKACSSESVFLGITYPLLRSEVILSYNTIFLILNQFYFHTCFFLA